MWRAGPFRLTPQIRIGGGYDSNATSSAFFPFEDLMFVAAPGIRAVVPMSNKGLVDLFQEVGFVYYRDLDQLQDFPLVSRAAGSFGGRDLVVRGQGEYRTGKVRPSSEVDIPLDQEISRFGGGLQLALGWRQDINISYESSRFRYQDPEVEDVGVSIPNRLDRTEEQYLLAFSRHVTSTTSVTVRGFYNILEYVNRAEERDGTGYGGLAGVAFAPRGDWRGEALFGYKRLLPEVSTQAEFTGFVGSANVRVPMGKRLAVNAVFLRDTQPSVLDNNWFFVENRGGGSLDIYLTERVFVRPGAVVGRNNYPRSSQFVNTDGKLVSEIVTDDFRIYSFSINYHLRPDLIAYGGGDWWFRESNLPQFNKDRFVLNVGITTEF
jgi:hypothetical protein